MASRIRELLRLVDQPGVLSLAGGLPAAEALDVPRVRAAAGRALDLVGPLGPVALQYGPTEGVETLRALLGRRLGVDAATVLVTTGSQQAIDLLARTWCGRDDTVVVEHPSYLGALQAFTAAGARIVAIGGDTDGIDVDHLSLELARGLRPRLVYVVPNFHNPTGSVLAADRRRRLAELADTHGFLIVEDDPYGELRFVGTPLASIADASARVVRLGSASKILAPGLRVGWLSGPPEVVDAAARLKQVADLHTPALNQLIVAELLGDEPAQRLHIDAIRARYHERAGALARALTQHLGDRVRHDAPRGGMFTWAIATDGTDTDALLPRALAAGVAFVPGSAFSAVPGSFPDAMRLSFATLDPGSLDRAVSRLRHAWDEPR